MRFKNKIYNHCIGLLNDKIKILHTALNDLTLGAESDSKSSAGDKHETARAMMQLEQQKTKQQLDEALIQKDVLDKINITKKTLHVTLGSLVKTNKGFLFLSVALGKVIVDEHVVTTLSSQSPLGKKLLGCRANDVAEVNGIKYVIEEIS